MPRFSLRFVLADGRPTQADLESLWPDGPAVRRLDDGVLELLDGDTLLARVDLLLAEGGRGRAMLAAIREEAQRIGDDGVVQTVGFFCEGAAGVVLAQPVIDEEDDLERALYGREPSGKWRGDRLARAFEALLEERADRQKPTRTGDLPPLYAPETGRRAA